MKKLEQQANDSSPAKPKAMLSTEKLSEYQQRVAVLKDILYPEQVAIKKETSNATKMRVQRDVHRVFRNQLLGVPYSSFEFVCVYIYMITFVYSS